MEANKKRLLQKVQQYEFAVIEAKEYLDSHPADQEAIRYFQNASRHLQQQLAAYEEKYGKIAAGEGEMTRWAWVDEPWPWQMEG